MSNVADLIVKIHICLVQNEKVLEFIFPQLFKSNFGKIFLAVFIVASGEAAFIIRN